MAILRGKSGHTELVLRPYRIAEKGKPTWVSVVFELKQQGVARLATILSLTLEDLSELRTGFHMIAAEISESFTLETMDGDLILMIQRLEIEDDIAVGFWVGEPYDLMTGFRFMVSAEALRHFASELLADESALAPPA